MSLEIKGAGMVVPTVDPETAEKLIAEYQTQAEETKNRGKQYARYLEDYQKLESTLLTVKDQVSFPSTMIPLSKKAFFEGELQHTNEIMVLLGDNWFVERSATQAHQICLRRIGKCTQKLEELNKELTLIESWSKEATQLVSKEDGDGNLEIREPYDEIAEAEWRERHKRSVHRFVISREKENTRDDEDEEELFKKLDELEIEEEMEKHEEKLQQESFQEEKPTEVLQESQLNKERVTDLEQNADVFDVLKEEANAEEDLSESPELSDSETEEEPEIVAAKTNYNTVPNPSSLKHVSRFSVSEVISEKGTAETSKSSIARNTRGEHLTSLQPRRRRVSFGSIREHLYSLNTDAEEPVAKMQSNFLSERKSHHHHQEHQLQSSADHNIYFVHQHVDERTSRKSDSDVPNDPSDLPRLYGADGQVKLKSILKPAGSSHSLHPRENDTGASQSFGRFFISPTREKSTLSEVVATAFPAATGTVAVSDSGIRVNCAKVSAPSELIVKPVSDNVLEMEKREVIKDKSCGAAAKRKQSRFKLTRVEPK